MSLNTQAAELIWDWFKIIIGLAKLSNWLFKSGVICACDCKRLIGYWSNLYRSDM